MSADDLPETPSDFKVPDDLAGWLDGDEGTTCLPSSRGAVTVVSGVFAWLAYRDRPDHATAATRTKRPGFGTVLGNRNLLLLGGVTLLRLASGLGEQEVKTA